MARAASSSALEPEDAGAVDHLAWAGPRSNVVDVPDKPPTISSHPAKKLDPESMAQWHKLKLLRGPCIPTDSKMITRVEMPYVGIPVVEGAGTNAQPVVDVQALQNPPVVPPIVPKPCLLYTSDAADE